MQAVYRLYTEDKNRDGVRAIVGKAFDGFSLFFGMGIWKGAEEKSLLVEVIADNNPDTARKVREVAQAIKIENEQEAVYLTAHELRAALI